jgi:HD domain
MTQRVTASVGLLWTFVLLSAVVLAGGCLILSALLTSAVKSQALDDSKLSLTQYANGVLAPRIVYGTSLRVGDSAASIVNRDLAERPDILSVKVWRTDGTLAWANLAPERIGEQFPIGADLREVFEAKEATAEFSSLGEEEDAVEAAMLPNDVIEVYAPLFAGQHEVIGAYEIYADAAPLEASIAGRKRAIWIASSALFALLWVLLMLLARNASGMLRRQTTALRERSAALSESYRLLEESSLEAIESLNATVEAKDPYTAGHSLRVQRISLSIAQELGVSPKELDAVRFGGIFHDIGKIAIPDVLLTKPAKLTDDEYELMTPLERRRPHRLQVRAPSGMRADHPPPPRAVGRCGLSRPPGRRGYPAARDRRRVRRRVGRHDHRAALPARAPDRRGACRGAREQRHPVLARRRGRFLRGRLQAPGRLRRPRLGSARRGLRPLYGGR